MRPFPILKKCALNLKISKIFVQKFAISKCLEDVNDFKFDISFLTTSIVNTHFSSLSKGTQKKAFNIVRQFLYKLKENIQNEVNRHTKMVKSYTNNMFQNIDDCTSNNKKNTSEKNQNEENDFSSQQDDNENDKITETDSNSDDDNNCLSDSDDNHTSELDYCKKKIEPEKKCTRNHFKFSNASNTSGVNSKNKENKNLKPTETDTEKDVISPKENNHESPIKSNSNHGIENTTPIKKNPELDFITPQKDDIHKILQNESPSKSLNKKLLLTPTRSSRTYTKKNVKKSGIDLNVQSKSGKSGENSKNSILVPDIKQTENKVKNRNTQEAGYQKSFSMSLTYDEWIKYFDINKNSVNSDWTNLIYNKFYEHNPNCVLSNKTSHFQKLGSRKRNSNYFRANFICKFTNCKTYKMVVKRKPKKGVNVKVSVYSSGEYCHNGERHRNFIKGDKRQEMTEKYKNDVPSMVALKLLYEAPDQVLKEGNITRAPTAEIISQMKKEEAQRSDLHSDDFVDLVMKYHEFNKDPYFQGKHVKGFIHRISYHPFSVVFYSEQQLQHVRNILKQNGTLNLYVDATGCVSRKPNHVEKSVYYYAIVAKEKGSETKGYPVAECFTSDNTICGIDYFLDKVVYDMRKIFSKKRVATKIETDFSFPMMQSVSRSFNRMDLINYINLTYDVETGLRSLPSELCIQHVCCSHVIHFVSNHISKLTSENPKSRSSLLTWFAHLQKCKSIKEAEFLIYHGSVLFSSETMNESAISSQQCLSEILNKDIDEEFIPETRISEIIDDTSEKKNQRESSHFYKHFKDIIEKAENTKNNNKTGEINSLYSPGFIEYVLNNILAYFPLWSGLMFKYLSDYKDFDFRETSSTIECWMKIIKHHRMLSKKNVKVGRCLSKAADHIKGINKNLIFSNISTRAENNGKKLKIKQENLSDVESVVDGADTFEKDTETWKKTGEKNKMKRHYHKIGLHEAMIPKKKCKLDDQEKDKLETIYEEPAEGSNCSENNAKTKSKLSLGKAKKKLAFESKDENKKEGKRKFNMYDTFFNEDELPYLPPEKNEHEQQDTESKQKEHDLDFQKKRMRKTPTKFKDYAMQPKIYKQSILDNTYEAPEFITFNYPECIKYTDEQKKKHCPKLVHGSVISMNHILTLRNECWLNDEIVHAFIALLQEENSFNKPGYNFTVMPPEYSQKIFLKDRYLLLHGAWLDYNFFEQDIVIIPLVHESHWYLLFFVMKQKKIILLDSMPNSNHDFSQKIILNFYLKNVQHLHVHQFNSEIDWNEWSIFCPNDIVDQGNAFDCGVHVCLYAYIFFKSKFLNYVADQMFDVRKFIAHTLMEASDNRHYEVQTTILRRMVSRSAVSSNLFLPENIKFSKSPPCKNSSTILYLSKLIDNLFVANMTQCGLAEKCLKPNEDMVYCAKCKEYYHMSCVRRLSIGPLPDVYKCPSCRKSDS